MNIEAVITASGYLGVFGLMIANGFVSFPSSQVLYIFVGYLASIGFFNFQLVAIVGALGNTAGNIILYELARSKGLEYITKFKVFPPREVKKVQAVFKRRGAWFLFVGKLLPAIKVFVPIPAGIAKMNRVLYAIIIFVSSYIWALAFLAIGFFFGKSSDVFGKYAIILSILALFVLFYFYRSMNSENIAEELDVVKK